MLGLPVSALGHWPPRDLTRGVAAIPPITDTKTYSRRVRFGPVTDIPSDSNSTNLFASIPPQSGRLAREIKKNPDESGLILQRLTMRRLVCLLRPFVIDTGPHDVVSEDGIDVRSVGAGASEGRENRC